MTAVVFTGPSLPPAEAADAFEARYLPPVAEGDVYRAVMEGASSVGIIDGFFENVPAVWHKEVLFALSRGIPVYGAASMGALRAAELAAFGMRGVGAIFEAFHDGILEDDDEVAVIHGPAELGYPQLSEAMVNIRRTLSDARGEGVVGSLAREGLEQIAKELPYRERTYHAILERACRAGVPEEDLKAFKSWLPGGRVDQKRADARLLLQVMRDDLAKGRAAAPPPFHFEHTTLWEQASRAAAQRGPLAAI